MSYTKDAITLLQSMIATPSFSKEEQQVHEVILNFFKERDISVATQQLNILVKNRHFDEAKPTILLNSHFDTVKPVASWTKDPFSPSLEEGKLYGLGSNDAGASLVSLIATFLHFYAEENLAFNILLAATAEEEISGPNGIIQIKDHFEKCKFAIVGEPTEMQMGIAEKGLMVLDGVVEGISGHAAREEGENAIYNCLQDIQWFKEYKFPKSSETLGELKMSLTQINSGTQHNVVPDKCSYVVDVRSIPEYNHEEILEIIRANTTAKIKARSTRLQPSGISKNHFAYRSAQRLNIQTFGSSTLSDQALLTIPSIKMGPGKSKRSHTADEYIRIVEIEEGIKTYIRLIKDFIEHWGNDNE